MQLRPAFSNEGLSAKDGTPIYPANLPISERLRDRLAAYHARLFDVVTGETILGIAPTSAGREEVWALMGTLNSDGLEIARALKAEVPDWTIYCYDVDAVVAEHQGQAPRIGVLIDTP